MQTSVKQIIESIETVATTYFSNEIKYVGFNKYPTGTIEKDCVALVYDIDSYPSGVNTSKVAIRFEFLDLLSTIDDRNDRRKEVYSDTDGVGSGFVEYLRRNNHYIDTNVAKDVIDAKGNNGMGGTQFVVTFNYQKGCVVTGDGYKFKALTVGQLIDTNEDFTLSIADVTDNDSGLDGTFKSVATTDEDLNLTLNEAKTTLTLQTDVGTDRFSNVVFTATNGVINSSANIVNYISFVVSNLLLDLYPNASLAISLRKLRTLYTGYSIRVRRSSDNSEKDIGFVSNVIDTASLLSFVGAGDGFVTIGYDQSINGNNAINTTASKQPKIVSNGSILTENSKPIMSFIDNNTNLEFTPVNFGTVFSAYKVDSYGGVNNLLGNGLFGASYEGLFTGGTITGYDGLGLIEDGNVVTSGFTENTDYNLAFYKNDGTTSYGFAMNGGVEVTRPYNSNFNIATISRDSSTVNLKGSVSELIIYDSDKTADKVGIETNINDYYSIY